MAHAVARVLVLALAFLMLGCVPTAVPFAAGPTASIPPDHVLVTGKIELKSDLTCRDFLDDRDKAYHPFRALSSSGTIDLEDHIQIYCSKYVRFWRADLDYTGKSGSLHLRAASLVDLLAGGEIFLPVTFNEDFYAILPRSRGYTFGKLESSEFSYPQFGFSDHLWIECPAGFELPRDTSVVYLGTIVLRHLSAYPKPEHRGSFLSATKEERVTLSVEDEYEQAQDRLRGRNPELRGNVGKSLVGEIEVDRWTGWNPNIIAGRKAKCRIARHDVLGSFLPFGLLLITP